MLHTASSRAAWWARHALAECLAARPKQQPEAAESARRRACSESSVLLNIREHIIMSLVLLLIKTRPGAMPDVLQASCAVGQ